MKKSGAGAKGHTSKHVGTSKHHAHTSKHNPRHTVKAHAHATAKAHVKGKHPSHARGLAVGDWLPVCSLEAVAMSLRLAGQFVDDEEVAWLWTLTGASPLGATIPAALDAAGEHGLAGLRPQWASLWGEGAHAADHLALPFIEDEARPLAHLDDLFAGDFHSLILGVDVPGPHAVLATPDGWWSWGELHSPWPATVEEAWAVSWA